MGSPVPSTSSNTSAYTSHTTSSASHFMSLNLSPTDSYSQRSELWAASAPVSPHLSSPRTKDNTGLERSEGFPALPHIDNLPVGSSAATPVKHNNNLRTVTTGTPPHRQPPLLDNVPPPPLLPSPLPLISIPIPALSPIPRHPDKYPTYLNNYNLTPLRLSPLTHYHPSHFIASNKTLHYWIHRLFIF